MKIIESKTCNFFEFIFFDSIANIPHFSPHLDNDPLPEEVIRLRLHISNADGIICCTPEYIFGIPALLKNIFEWCVSTTVFTDKKAGLITASASGIKGHEQLKLIMSTLGATFDEETTLLISGIKGKFDKTGALIDLQTLEKIDNFIVSFQKLFN